MRFHRVRKAFPLLLAAVAALYLPGCLKLSDLSETERLFPDSALSGAAARATVRDVVEAKGTDGLEITAAAVIPSNPRTEQLRPTGLTILRRLKEKYPDAKSIRVAIYDDERAVTLGLSVANAAYASGTVRITGGLPTEAEVAAVESGRSASAGSSPFAQPREEDFNIAHKVFEISNSAPSSGAIPGTAAGSEASNGESERKAAAFFRIPPGRVKSALFNLSNWYGMHRETILHEAK